VGEHGKLGDPPVCSRADVGRVRQVELLDACRELGIATLRVLGYQDRSLACAPPDTIRRQLVEVIRATCPQVVVTFDPNGSNLHPDHIAISRFTADAVAAAGDARWFPDLGAAHAVARLAWTLPVRPWELLRRTDPVCEPGADFAVDVSRFVAQKTAALRAHRTQHLGIQRIFFSKPDVTRLLSVELFRQAFGPPLVTRPADDLFADLP
jgi:LmbE family N-acetylglucosaminyl deacetylase